VTAFAGVVLLGTLKGIIIAIIVSMVALAYQAADPPVYVLGRKPGTNVFRPRSPENPAARGAVQANEVAGAVYRRAANAIGLI
jgi:MFS superfamily sulfate permease-like transporter